MKRNDSKLIIYNIQKIISLLVITSYFYYEKCNIKCLVALSYSRYSEYIKAGSYVKYNVYSPSEVEWRKIKKENVSLYTE